MADPGSKRFSVAVPSVFSAFPVISVGKSFLRCRAGQNPGLLV
jgi:hypothetical protein